MRHSTLSKCSDATTVWLCVDFVGINVSDDCAASSCTIIDRDKCEVREVIQYFLHEGHSAAKIHRWLVVAYGPNMMNKQNVANWVHEFNDGRISVHDEDRSGRQTIMTYKFDVKVQEQTDNCR